jgi:alginate O-acetyltransferase complex protein AlgI
MLFVEFRFLIFFLVVFSVYWALRGNTSRKVWLLACSYFFYGAWDWRFLLILIASTTLDYTVGMLLVYLRAPGARRACVALSLCINLGLICFFKYFNFFVESASGFLFWIGLPASLTTLKIIIPVGVSFFTFQSMSYTIDIYRGRLKAVRNFLDLAFFVSFFPQLVAGPIVRAISFLPQLVERRKFANVDVRAALTLFLLGFVKKACIADTVAPEVDRYFADPGRFTAISGWLAVLSYAVQIYCDFSGYTDMAIACARLLGYELTVNFSFPYFSHSVTEFWRRWHISLSTWLRDYLYISLGGNRGSIFFTYRNLMLTMLLGGLWHGSRWTFAIWGTLHGLALVVHREWLRWIERRQSAAAVTLPSSAGPVRRPLPVWAPGFFSAGETFLATALTFYWTCITWIFFRSADLTKPMTFADFHTAKTVLKAFVLFKSKGHHVLGAYIIWLLFGLAIVHWLNYRRTFSGWWRRGPDVVFAAGYGCVVALVLLFIPTRYSPFIYFQF